MTEDEAKTKWCPMVRNESPQGDGNGSWNRGRGDDTANVGQPNLYPCNCVASACMMWRGGINFGFRDGVEFSEKTGYCGLAGKP